MGALRLRYDDNRTAEEREQYRESRTLIHTATSKLKRGERITEPEAHALGLNRAGFGPNEAMARLAEVIRNPPRNAQAIIMGLQTYLKIVGAEAPAEVTHQHNVTLDLAGLHDRIREATSDASPLEVEPAAVLPGVSGVDALEATGRGDVRDRAETEPRGRDGRNGDGARRG